MGLTIVRALALLIICGLLGRSMIEVSKLLPVRVGLDLFFLWPAAAITIKRGHDRNRSTTYSIVVLAALYGGGWALSVVQLVMNNQWLYFGMSLLMLPFIIYLLVDYGLIDGTKGANRYGPSPKNHQDATLQVPVVLD